MHPQSNILQAGFKPGEKIGDFGCGSGHGALALSGIVGERGKIYAVDIQRDLLHTLEKDISARRIKNIDLIRGDIEKEGGTHLHDESLDSVVLSNVLFQIDDFPGLMREIWRTLKPGGKLLVSDWAGSYGGMGPDKERLVPEYRAEEIFIEAGFHKAKSYRAGVHHYSLVFTKPS